MRIFFRSLLLFASVFSAAYIARVTIVPNVVPIGDGEQSNWQIQVAFFFTSVQNIGLFGMVLVVLVALPSLLRSLVARMGVR
jgi:hypothetical protein